MKTFFCEICHDVVAVAEDTVKLPEKVYCSLHHPDPAFKVEDKPVPKMTVRVQND